VHLVRRELVVPLQLAGTRIEGYDGMSVEVVAFAFITVVVGTRISSGPIQEPRFGIVRAGEPRRATAVLEGTADPGFRARFAACWDRPKTLGALAR